jgi:hypothetical protein
MHTENIQLDTAVGPAGPAGDALAAFQVGHNRNRITLLKIGVPSGYGFDFTGQFVAEDTGIRKEWLSALIRVKIRTANTDSPDSYQRFVRCRNRHVRIIYLHLVGFLTHCNFHSIHLARLLIIKN